MVTDLQITEKFPALYETRSSVICTQQLATCPYPESEKPQSTPSHPNPLRSILLLPSYLFLRFSFRFPYRPLLPTLLTLSKQYLYIQFLLDRKHTTSALQRQVVKRYLLKSTCLL